MMNLPPGHWVSGTEYSVICPECGSSAKAFLNPYKGRAHCKSSHCGWVAYNKAEIYEAFDIDPDDEDWKGLAPVQAPRNQERGYTLTGMIPAWLDPKARAYLAGKRGLSEKIVQAGGIEYSVKLQRFVVMLEPFTADLRSRQATRYPGSIGKWYPAFEGISLSEYGYGLRFIPAQADGIVLMEGIFDVLATRMLGRGIAMMGTKLTLSGLMWLKRFKRVIVWVDPDNAGRNFCDHYVKQIKCGGSEVTVIKEKDPKLLRPDRKKEDATLIRHVRDLVDGKVVWA